MTRERDIERVLDRFFAEGPVSMPDRFFRDAFDRIDHVPQRRLAALELRFAAMTQNARLAVAAAIVAAVGIVGALALNSWSQVANHPSPSPQASSTPAPSLAASAVPAALRHRWIGATRAVPGMAPQPDASSVVLAASLMRFDAGSAGTNAFASTTSAIAPDEIRVVLSSAIAGCQKGDAGTYRYDLSAGGDYLTLSSIADDCAARTAALSGDWERSACPDVNRLCLGDLEAGNHRSVDFSPFVPFSEWTYDYGRFSYTVPAGWANDQEDRTLYVISKQGIGEDQSIWLLSDEGAHVQAADCAEGQVDSTVERTPTALAAWLASVPGITTTTPQSITLGGLSGVTLDVSLKPSWTRACPDTGDLPSVKMFADTHAGGQHDVDVRGDAPMRIILLDLGDARTLLIYVHAKDKATYDTLLPEAMAIIDSFVFTR